MVISIIPREAWGAQEPRIRRPIVLPVDNVAEDHWCPITINKYHLWKACTTREECEERCRLIQKMALDKDQSDLNYSFLIGGDGNVYEGRGWNTLLTETWRWSGFNIAYIGRFTKENPPTEQMVDTFNELVEFGKKRMYIKENAFILNHHNRRQEDFHDCKTKYEK